MVVLVQWLLITINKYKFIIGDENNNEIFVDYDKIVYGIKRILVFDSLDELNNKNNKMLLEKNNREQLFRIVQFERQCVLIQKK